MTTVGNHEVGSVVVDLFWCRLLVLPADGLPRHCSCIPLRLVPPTALAVDTAEVSMPLVWCPLWAPRRPPSLPPVLPFCAARLAPLRRPLPRAVRQRRRVRGALLPPHPHAHPCRGQALVQLRLWAHPLLPVQHGWAPFLPAVPASAAPRSAPQEAAGGVQGRDSRMPLLTCRVYLAP